MNKYMGEDKAFFQSRELTNTLKKKRNSFGNHQWIIHSSKKYQWMVKSDVKIWWKTEYFLQNAYYKRKNRFPPTPQWRNMADIILRNWVYVTSNRTNHHVLLDRMQWEEPERHLTFWTLKFEFHIPFKFQKIFPFLPQSLSSDF